jgi:hypothetical protein
VSTLEARTAQLQQQQQGRQRLDLIAAQWPTPWSDQDRSLLLWVLARCYHLLPLSECGRPA